MTPEQFFVEQAKFNKWLFDLTSDEAKHITSMLNEYAEAKAKEAFEAARGIDYNGTNEYYFADYEDYKTTS